VQTYRRKKMRSKKLQTRKYKGGAPTPAQLLKNSKGLTRKSRPLPLKLSKSSSPRDTPKYLYNPISPTHVKILAKKRKQNIINKPLSPTHQLHINEIYRNIPPDMDQNTQYFYIDGDEPREIFKFGMNDTQLQPTGFAYIDHEWKKL